MNSYKVILAEAKAMKSTCPTDYGVSTGRIRFQEAKKRPVEGKDLNALVYNTVKEVLKSKKSLKPKASNDSVLEDEQENFNFETLHIGE